MKQASGTGALARARSLRRTATDAEKRLWLAIRNRALNGAKFRRQVWLGPYIADFVCLEARLIVEVDGGQHGDERDMRRDQALAEMGYRVLRFWNHEVLGNEEGVLSTMADALPSPSHRFAAGPSLSRRERG